MLFLPLLSAGEQLSILTGKYRTRKDLGMGKGKIAAQVAHAAVECSMKVSEKRTRWISEGQKKIVVWSKMRRNFRS